MPFESTPFRAEMETIVGGPISDDDADNIIVGLMYLALRCEDPTEQQIKPQNVDDTITGPLGCETSTELQTEPQSKTREELRQMLIRKPRPNIGKSPASSTPRTKTKDWRLELEEHRDGCLTAYVITEVCHVHPIAIQC